ncbi:MAG: insulinase family protein [Holosporaceae bacterium]|jgi:predicted Zn-dependent peptidase|nr:insulinase family protein [Holosporaceae bacterium]
MFKTLAIISSLLIFFWSDAYKYAGSSFQKLDNGVSVVFVDTAEADTLLVVLCISSGNTDEVDKRGVANLLRYMFDKKLKEKVAKDSIQYGSESNSCTGHDQSIYYLYGKVGNLKGFIRNLGTIHSSVTFSAEDLKDGKNATKQHSIEELQSDKNIIHYEAKKSMYWHSNYGTRITGEHDDIEAITEEDVRNFKDKNYTNERTTIIIVGNVNKEQALEEISRYFVSKGKAPTNRVQEPPHHGSTTRITKYSAQVSATIVEMYWRIPNYRKQRNEARAAEIFVQYLKKAIQESLIGKEIASSISFCDSFWNYDYGDICMTVTLRSKSDIQDVEEQIRAIITEIKYIASNDITEEQAKKAAQEVRDAADVFKKDVEVADTVEWISKRVGAGYDFDFLKSHNEFMSQFDLKDVNAQGKEIFKKDPCVISVIKPMAKQSAD